MLRQLDSSLPGQISERRFFFTSLFSKRLSTKTAEKAPPEALKALKNALEEVFQKPNTYPELREVRPIRGGEVPGGESIGDILNIIARASTLKEVHSQIERLKEFYPTSVELFGRLREVLSGVGYRWAEKATALDEIWGLLCLVKETYPFLFKKVIEETAQGFARNELENGKPIVDFFTKVKSDFSETLTSVLASFGKDLCQAKSEIALLRFLGLLRRYPVAEEATQKFAIEQIAKGFAAPFRFWSDTSLTPYDFIRCLHLVFPQYVPRALEILITDFLTGDELSLPKPEKVQELLDKLSCHFAKLVPTFLESLAKVRFEKKPTIYIEEEHLLHALVVTWERGKQVALFDKCRHLVPDLAIILTAGLLGQSRLDAARNARLNKAQRQQLLMGLMRFNYTQTKAWLDPGIYVWLFQEQALPMDLNRHVASFLYPLLPERQQDLLEKMALRFFPTRLVAAPVIAEEEQAAAEPASPGLG